mgnify:FL=1
MKNHIFSNLTAIAGLIVLILLSSCTFETDELTYVEIERPSDAHPVTVNLTPDKDSIVIYGSASFTYDINTFGEKFSYVKIKYFDVDVQRPSENSSFTIRPDNAAYSNWFDVTLEYYFSTGTGSLADKLGLENYRGSKTWKVKYVNLYTFDYKFNHRISPDSILEFYWIKPHGDLKPSIIEITTSGWFDTLKVDRIIGDTIFYKDRNFFGGEKSYYARISPFEPNVATNKSFNISYPKPMLYFTDIYPDSCIISCTKSIFKTIYQLVDYNQKVVYQGNKAFAYKDLAPPIGSKKLYCLYCYRPDETVFNSEHQKYYNAQEYSPGKKMPFDISYAKDVNLFYLAKRDSDVTYSGYPLIFEEPYAYSNFENFQSNSNGSLKAGVASYTISVFGKENKLQETISIPYYLDYYDLMVADNNTLGYYNTQLSEYIIKNYGTDKSWTVFSFNPRFNDFTKGNYPHGISGTSDGKYVMCKGDKDFYLYDVSDHATAKLIYSSKIHKQAIENSANQNEIILLQDKKIEVRSLPDMNLLREAVVFYPGIILLNVDPYSNILAYSSSNYIVLMNINTMKEIAKFRTTLSYDNRTRLLRKQLITKNKRILDLNNYLP